MQTAQQMTRTSQNQKEDISYLPHPPTPGTEPLQTIPQPRARRAELALLPLKLWICTSEVNRKSSV